MSSCDEEAKGDLLPVERREVVHRERQRISADLRAKPKFAGKVGAFIDRMVHEGEDWKTAAKAVGIRQNQARPLLGHPKIISEMQNRARMLRAREGLRNPAVATKIRDRALKDDATAAQQKVSLEAARYLDGESSPTGITINGGNNVIAGYVVKLDGPAEGPRLGGNQRHPEPESPATYFDPRDSKPPTDR